MSTKNENLPDGIEFDGEIYWATCPECGWQQADMGNNVACDECGFGPMPTMDNGQDQAPVQPDRSIPAPGWMGNINPVGCEPDVP